MKLSDISEYRKGKIDLDILNKKNYISTDNMLPDKKGIVDAVSLPNMEKTQIYKKGDVLISNIRPYFKKIYYAKADGGCSNDVLVFQAKENIFGKYLYYLLSDDKFFSYSTATSKGTKMPRGDKKAIMDYEISSIDFISQQKIAKILSALDDKIELNNRINKNLEEQAQALFKSWFVDFEPFGGVMPGDWKIYKLSEFLPVITGKKNANVACEKGIYPFFSCSQDILWTDDYSFEGNAILVAGNGEFNVKCYNGKFEAYQRTYVLIPYNSNYTALLYNAVKYNLGEITSAARGSVIKFITKGNLEDFSFAAPKNLEEFKLLKVFTAINKNIANNTSENQKLAQLRDTLLPKLINGEIDVEKVEII